MQEYDARMTMPPVQPKLYESGRVVLRRLAREDQEEYTALARASAELHNPWIYAPTTPAEFDSYLERFDHVASEGTVICARESGAITGFVNISEIIRGPYLRASVGYGAFVPFAGNGYMSEGFELILKFAFNDLGLHRLEADIQPGNMASVNLVKRVGFQYEGFSPRFIYIRGIWRDHERWAVTSDMVASRLT